MLETVTDGEIIETEIRRNGEIRVRSSGSAMRDSLLGRDSVRVATLLERIRELPWDSLHLAPLPKYGWCLLSATWVSEARGVRWELMEPPAALAEAGRIHEAIRALAHGDTLGVARLETGCNGGATGGGGGTIVTADGRFYSYVRPTWHDMRTLTLTRRDSARAATFFTAAVRGGLGRVEFSQPSNMSCSLTLVEQGKRSTVTWPIGTTPRRIRSLVELAQRIAAAQ